MDPLILALDRRSSVKLSLLGILTGATETGTRTFDRVQDEALYAIYFVNKKTRRLDEQTANSRLLIPSLIRRKLPRYSSEQTTMSLSRRTSYKTSQTNDFLQPS
ncbi:hypothetical protein FOCG_06980 [Fusarium oxysporum f. sp. radicis-lycopersici 26381]|uniref:Uncharacterized protein n=1 Tax=Fusarium oxysporum Fo47 TaxID=660027 RepID=W9L5J1_FUSOX|nr:hypothetical protein FOZG_04039 [Fusarium oxysporum Fo47]EWZ93583.1 hypothetical protein FOWG_06276 [Fusarium oxysporum f. sp. lycopersici MN25]EXL53848.1 hypothetical protein FOCG_06980 [Fusarium oxysporum f. sp. radicis-lycopersici 26381]KAJ0154089.1 hypothetical protein HZ326_3593 [Fusarium oxysporum f. sp. albedinis]